MRGVVHQVNLKPETPGERGLPKRPVDAAFVGRRGLSGDFNLWRHAERHDDLDMAILLLPLETIVQLASEGWTLNPGDVGENVTTRGVPYGDFGAGRKYRIGEGIVQISKPCDPCRNLKHLPYVGQERIAAFIQVMNGRRGWYARVLQEGPVKAKDSIEEVPG